MIANFPRFYKGGFWVLRKTGSGSRSPGATAASAVPRHATRRVGTADTPVPQRRKPPAASRQVKICGQNHASRCSSPAA